MQARLAIACLVFSCSLAQPASAQLRRGPWAKDKVPDGWVLHETAHYQIQSEAGLDKAKRLGTHMETLHKTYMTLFPPERDSTKRYAIKLLKDRKSFLGYGAPPGAGAYYSPTDREMVCYDTGTWLDAPPATPLTPESRGSEPTDEQKEAARLERLRKIFDMDILGAASHEGWHQYFHWYVVSWCELPSWINEGMGDYFYTAMPKVEKGKRLPPQLGRSNPMRLVVIKHAVEANGHVPLKELLKYSKSQYYANPSVCYAEGWALCQFMLHGGNPAYAKVIQRFIELVRDDTKMDVVTEKAFKGIDLDKLEAEFVAWVKAQKLDW